MDLSSLEGYPFRYCGCDSVHDGPLEVIHRYSFKNRKGIAYIVNVEQYTHKMYVVKFHLKKQAHSKWRYSFMNNEGDARKIIYTCVEIGLSIFKKDAFASFGFIGSPTRKEAKTSRMHNTKRFKVYNYFAKFFFSPSNFDHFYNIEKSGYILINKAHKNRTPNLFTSIAEMFENYYDIDRLYLPDDHKKN